MEGILFCSELVKKSQVNVSLGSVAACFGACPGATALNLLNCNCMCETGFVYSEDYQECVGKIKKKTQTYPNFKIRL